MLEFEKNYNHIEIENKIVSRWEEDKLFYGFNANNKKIFSIDTPPPTASGYLHIGHVFSYFCVASNDLLRCHHPAPTGVRKQSISCLVRRPSAQPIFGALRE